MPDEQQTLLNLEKRELTPDALWQAAQDASLAIETAELEILREEEWLREQRWRLERNEINMLIRVSAEKVDRADPDSKNVYTNDTQRKAAVSERLGKDPQHRELLAALTLAEKNQAVRKITLDRLGRDYTMAKLRYEALTIGKRYEH